MIIHPPRRRRVGEEGAARDHPRPFMIINGMRNRDRQHFQAHRLAGARVPRPAGEEPPPALQNPAPPLPQPRNPAPPQPRNPAPEVRVPAPPVPGDPHRIAVGHLHVQAHPPPIGYLHEDRLRLRGNYHMMEERRARRRVFRLRHGRPFLPGRVRGERVQAAGQLPQQNPIVPPVPVLNEVFNRIPWNPPQQPAGEAVLQPVPNIAEVPVVVPVGPAAAQVDPIAAVPVGLIPAVPVGPVEPVEPPPDQVPPLAAEQAPEGPAAAARRARREAMDAALDPPRPEAGEGQPIPVLAPIPAAPPLRPHRHPLNIAVQAQDLREFVGRGAVRLGDGRLNIEIELPAGEEVAAREARLQHYRTDQREGPFFGLDARNMQVLPTRVALIGEEFFRRVKCSLTGEFPPNHFYLTPHLLHLAELATSRIRTTIGLPSDEPITVPLVRRTIPFYPAFDSKMPQQALLEERVDAIVQNLIADIRDSFRSLPVHVNMEIRGFQRASPDTTPEPQGDRVTVATQYFHRKFTELFLQEPLKLENLTISPGVLDPRGNHRLLHRVLQVSLGAPFQDVHQPPPENVALDTRDLTVDLGTSARRLSHASGDGKADSSSSFDKEHGSPPSKQNSDCSSSSEDCAALPTKSRGKKRKVKQHQNSVKISKTDGSLSN